VQVIPHVTDAIKSFILDGNEEFDFVLCENSSDPNVPVAAQLKPYA